MSLHIEERGRGDALLFLPGFTESADEFERLVATLADRYHVIAIDLPGSGRSGPQPRAYTADLYEDDARLVAKVLAERGIESCVLVGFSDGGEVAVLLAARRPDLVRAVVAWGTAGVVPGAMTPWLAAFAELVDHPTDRLRPWRDALVARYGADVARATLQ